MPAGSKEDGIPAVEKKPYDLNDELRDGNVEKRYHLKDSLWSAAVVMPMVCRWPDSSLCWTKAYWHRVIKFALPSVMHVGLLVMIEAFIIEKISSVWEAEFDCSEEPIAFTAYLCIGCLCLYVLGSDLVDAITTLQWISQIPTRSWNDDSHLSFKFETKEIEIIEGDKTIATKYIETCKPSFGMSIPFRLYAVMLMLVRIGLTGIVLTLGSGYILRSREPEKQILASLTMVFLVELDDISYKLLQPDMVKSKLDSIPALVVVVKARSNPESNKLDYSRLYDFEPYWAYFSVALLVYVSGMMVQAWCNKEQVTSSMGFGIPLALVFVIVLGLLFVCRSSKPDGDQQQVRDENLVRSNNSQNDTERQEAWSKDTTLTSVVPLNQEG